MSDEEIWRVIPFATDYAASSSGKIMRVVDGATRKAGFVLSAVSTSKGRYLSVKLRVCGKPKMVQIHTAVLSAFKGPRPTPNHQCAHGDGNGHNNAAENLRWETVSGNNRDKVAHGTSQHGERNPGARLTEEQVTEIRKRLWTRDETARRYGIGRTTVDRIWRRLNWKHVA